MDLHVAAYGSSGAAVETVTEEATQAQKLVYTENDLPLVPAMASHSLTWRPTFSL